MILRRYFKEKLRDLYWKIYGVSIRNPEVPEKVRSFLFVCKGNICRSPFAERLAHNLGRTGRIEGAEFYSAGLHVSKPGPPPHEALKAAEHFGVQIDGHLSRGISFEMIESFDMILAMEVSQYHSLKKQYPRSQNKMFLLPLFEVEEKIKKRNYYLFHIPDPYGKSLAQFLVCFQRIQTCLQALFSRIENNQVLGNKK